MRDPTLRNKAKDGAPRLVVATVHVATGIFLSPVCSVWSARDNRLVPEYDTGTAAQNPGFLGSLSAIHGVGGNGSWEKARGYPCVHSRRKMWVCLLLTYLPSHSSPRHSLRMQGDSASFLESRKSGQMTRAHARERRSMKLRSYFVFAAMTLGWAAVLNAQQNFVAASVSSVVSCVSKGKERQQCSADTRAGIVMLRPTGEATCLLGRNWGYDDQGVWVSEGCGGDFGTGSTSRRCTVGNGNGSGTG